MDGERVVGGLRCRDVLSDLSDYLDGLLATERREQIDTHLRGCQNCERFGGEFGSAIAALRRTLGKPEPPDEDVVRRLHARLHNELR
jgi:anti-sigma factor RsiW